MILAILGAALAVEPLLGPAGWTTLGPIPAGDPRGSVAFDPRTCAPEVGRLDVDGGPENRDVRLARVWEDGAWRWADDWSVRGGALVRPGHPPSALPPDGEFGGEKLAFDASGRLVARERGGRRLEILRGDDGRFVGMRAGPVRVELDATAERATTGDGREVRYRWEGGELRSVADAGGVKAVYAYAGGRLATITWPDGAGLALEDGGSRVRTRGVGGTWTCEVRSGGVGGRVVVTGPAGPWIVERTGDAVAVTDPSGATVRSTWVAGRLAGWTDPRGGVARIQRDAEGRVRGVTDATGRGWGFTWSEGRLSEVTAPDGGAWTVTQSRDGTRVDDPSGRAATWERDGAGRLRRVRIGASGWELARDGAGRVASFADPVGARVRLDRDGAGRVTKIVDPGGAVWVFGRDGRGLVSRIEAPGGARWDVERDALGRPTGVKDPTGAWSRWWLAAEGRPSRVSLAGRAWALLWNAAGALTGVRDPAGRTTGWTRDGAGRARAVLRADGSVVRLDRDAAGEIVGVGGALSVARDAAGRPIGITAEGAAIAWDRDASARVVGVSAPGVALAVARDRAGAVREIRAGAEEPVRFARDAQGRVIAADGGGRVGIARDAAGRATGLTGDTVPLVLDRDVRGLIARITLGGVSWVLGRDATARVVEVDGPDGARLGVDRDAAGRPAFVRFPASTLATFAWDDAGAARVVLADRDGGVLGEAGWVRGADGALERLRAAGAWLLRRDPLGTLVAVEGQGAAWSNAPDGVEGPGGAEVGYDAAGRPASARLPEGWSGPWARGAAYAVAEDGGVRLIEGPQGRYELAWDAIGRLAGWRGPAGRVAVRRDPLGRLVAVGTRETVGWDAPLRIGGGGRAAVPGLAWADGDGGMLFDPRGMPVLDARRGAVASAPGGAVDAAGAELVAGRYAAVDNGPLVGLFDAVDPVSGQRLDPGVRWPWAPRAWEVEPSQSPWADPDGAADGLSWDPAPWDPEGPWADPLALLAAAGDLPDGGPRARRAPGVPWLPASFSDEPPRVLPDPLAWTRGEAPSARALDEAPLAWAVEEEPLVAWALAHASPPTSAPEPGEVAALLLDTWIRGRARMPPGLAPPLPDELRGLTPGG